MRIVYFFVILSMSVLLALSPSWSSSMFDEALSAYNNKNYTKAAELFLHEANRGDAQAQYNIGIMYANGEGVIQNYREAVKWYKLAADQGNARAQGSLGLAHVMGQGVPEDFTVAYAWLVIAANNGDALSHDHMKVIIVNMTPSQVEKAKEMAEKYSARTNK